MNGPIRLRTFFVLLCAACLPLAPLATAQGKPKPSLFKPIPLTEMEADQFVAYGAMVEKRKKFLSEPNLPYLKLAATITESMKAATSLIAKGDAEQAMAALQPIAAIRPIEDIPTPELISLYSFILGKLGQTDQQRSMRFFLFGINQAIAQSGDGFSPKSAVPVIFVSEEYAWLKDKDLTLVKQTIEQDEAHAYDVMTARDQTGMERDYYFEITPLYKRYQQALTR